MNYGSIEKSETCCGELRQATLSEKLTMRKNRALAEVAAIETCEKYLRENSSAAEFMDCLRQIGI